MGSSASSPIRRRRCSTKVSPYLVSFQIDPLGKMITLARTKIGTADIMISGTMLMAYHSDAVNHHLEEHLLNWKTGTV